MGGLANPKKDRLPERLAAKVHRCIDADTLPQYLWFWQNKGAIFVEQKL